VAADRTRAARSRRSARFAADCRTASARCRSSTGRLWVHSDRRYGPRVSMLTLRCHVTGVRRIPRRAASDAAGAVARHAGLTFFAKFSGRRCHSIVRYHCRAQSHTPIFRPNLPTAGIIPVSVGVLRIRGRDCSNLLRARSCPHPTDASWVFPGQPASSGQRILGVRLAIAGFSDKMQWHPDRMRTGDDTVGTEIKGI
jgi:hypothetical protein